MRHVVIQVLILGRGLAILCAAACFATVFGTWMWLIFAEEGPRWARWLARGAGIIAAAYAIGALTSCAIVHET